MNSPFARTVHPIQPPPFAIDADLTWVLEAAFSERRSLETPPSPERALELAERFDLSNQITVRCSASELDRALTEKLGTRLRQQIQRRIIHGLATIRARDRVCQIALETMVDVCLLKQAALDAMGLSSPTQRYASDVDLLVGAADRPRLSDALLCTGFRLVTDRTHQHGVVVVRDPDGIGVELHTQLHGVTLPGGADAAVDFGDLRRLELALAMGSSNPRIFLPSRAVLAAHLLVQGWYLFHFAPNAPRHKSTLRVVGDLILLGVHRDDVLAREMRAMVEAEVPEQEFHALLELARALEQGDWERSESASKALRHAIAATLDEEYRTGLIWNRQFDAMRREGIYGWAYRNLRRGLFPQSGDIENLVKRGEASNDLGARVRHLSSLAVHGLRGAWTSLGRRRL